MLPAGVATVLSVLRSSAVVVDDDDEVVKASAPALAFGLVRGQRLASAELADARPAGTPGRRRSARPSWSCPARTAPRAR